MGALRGVKPDAAIWRPDAGRHNIAELTIHAAYWKYRACRLISDASPRSFELTGSDFMERSAPYTVREWKADTALLVTWHGRFRSAVAELPGARLTDIVTDTFTTADVVTGVAAHDLYHAGQIQLLKRLWKR